MSNQVKEWRKEFPILQRTVHGHPLIYFDNAATTQRPKAVLEAMDNLYLKSNANVHRGVHLLSEEATQAYEGARTKVQKFIGAKSSEEVIFTSGTTESINLVAQCLSQNLKPGDEIVIAELEHHSNIVPWYIACEKTGAKLRILPFDAAKGSLKYDDLSGLLTSRTKIVSLNHVSNALGIINDIQRVVKMCAGKGITTVIDGAQAMAHVPVNVVEIGCDFYALSGHKMFGPTGIGALYGKKEKLEALPPYQSGGEMILSVAFDKVTYNKVPHKFEAGTPNFAGAVGLGAAIDFVDGVGKAEIGKYEDTLTAALRECLAKVHGVNIIGDSKNKVPILTFTLDGIHPHDIGSILDREGVAIRTGHHCAQPLHDKLGLAATARASLSFYNTVEEIEQFAKAVSKVREVFK